VPTKWLALIVIVGGGAAATLGYHGKRTLSIVLTVIVMATAVAATLGLLG